MLKGIGNSIPFNNKGGITMKDVLNSIWNRINNKGSILAIVSGLVTIAIQLGFKVDSEQIMSIVESICGLLILAGILNNPVNTKEMYIPGVKDQLIEKKVETKEEVVKGLPTDDLKANQ